MKPSSLAIAFIILSIIVVSGCAQQQPIVETKYVCPDCVTTVSDPTQCPKPATVPPSPMTQCFSDVQCFNGGNPVPISKTQYYIQGCINNQCKNSEEITVECTNDAACGATGKICDTALASPTKFTCIRQSGSGY